MLEWIFGRRPSAGSTGPIALASSHYKSGRLAEAEVALRELLAADPSLHEAQFMLGHVLRDSGRLDEAISSYRRAIALKADYADAYIAWGNVLNDQGRPNEAAALYLDAIKYDPDAPDAYANLGNSLQYMGQLDRARYRGLMQRADALLDTVGFSGFNVAIQAVECCLPIVAWDGQFLRGRLASGILKRMGMHELVARSENDYATIAVRLARDKEYRDLMRAQMLERRHLLFEDTVAVRALEDFLVSAASK